MTSAPLGIEIRRARVNQGLMQAEFARRMGVKPPYVAALEAGKRNVTLGQLANIADALSAAPSTSTFPVVVGRVWAGLRRVGRDHRIAAALLLARTVSAPAAKTGSPHTVGGAGRSAHGVCLVAFRRAGEDHLALGLRADARGPSGDVCSRRPVPRRLKCLHVRVASPPVASSAFAMPRAASIVVAQDDSGRRRQARWSRRARAPGGRDGHFARARPSTC